jgi:ATP-dependent phosphoenolpyruvate carboxykinase
MYQMRCTLERWLVANRVVDEEGRYDYDHKSEDENTRKE